MGVADLIDILAAGSLWIATVDVRGKREYESPVHEVADGFTSAIASWNVSTPGGSWISVALRARIGTRFTRWYAMGNWSATLDRGHRHSIAKQDDADGSVDTDTLNLKQPAGALQLRVDLHAGSNGDMPALSLVAVSTDRGETASQPATASAELSTWGTDLAVPELTQRVGAENGKYGGGGDSWCSPTSVAMVMGYWGAVLHRAEWTVDVPSAAQGTYDPVYDGCGNWPFNIAFASERGLRGWVQRLPSLYGIERLVARHVPVIASIKVRAGELDGAPYPSTDGHLLVVRGFTSTGDVIVNDPYGEPGAIRRIYRRDQFERVWQTGSHGAIYVVVPPSVKI